MQEEETDKPEDAANAKDAVPACPVCGGHLIEIRGKLQCEQCHRICESCCEGGLG